MNEEYKDWWTVPLPEGEPDCHRTRMERWERANNIQLSSLSDDEWLEVVAPMCSMPIDEAKDWLRSMRRDDRW